MHRLRRRRIWSTDNGHWIPLYIRSPVWTAPMFPTLCPPTTRGIQTPWQAQSKLAITCQPAGTQRATHKPTTSNSGRQPDAHCLAKSNRSCALHGSVAMVAIDPTPLLWAIGVVHEGAIGML